MSALSPVAKAALRHPVGRCRGDGITAAVFGATGFLGRYVCSHLGACYLHLWGDFSLAARSLLTGLTRAFSVGLLRDSWKWIRGSLPWR